MTIPEAAWIPISALNHFAFCERRCYYIHVEQLFEENAHTIQGHIHHRKVHMEHQESKAGVESHYQMYLFSAAYGLYGMGDKIEISRQEIVPIEYKSGRRKRWRNDRLQLCAQALCIEEMFQREVPRGFLFYQKNRRREEVQFDANLRRQTLDVSERIRQLFETQRRPPNPYHKRCEGCSFLPLCLPKEMAQLAQLQEE